MAKTFNGGSWEEYRNLLLTQMEQVFNALEEVKRNTEVASKERVHLDIKLSELLRKQDEYQKNQEEFRSDLESLRQQFNGWMHEQAVTKAAEQKEERDVKKAASEPRKPAEVLAEEVKQRWQLYAIIILTLADLFARWFHL